MDGAILNKCTERKGDMERDKFQTRFGFIMTAAGCAVGLGNVWRFPYIAGMYGGAAFIIIYIFCAALIGAPIITMEMAIGRKSRKSMVCAFAELSPACSKWKVVKPLFVAGNYIFMMFYTSVAAWIALYIVKSLKGEFEGIDIAGADISYHGMLADTPPFLGTTFLIIILAFAVCALGMKRGVERCSKVMLPFLFLMMVFLAVYNITLPGAGEGFRFYLFPDFQKVKEIGIFYVFSVALEQAFYSIGGGLGTMVIFGSYLSREYTLTNEALCIAGLDTLVAVVAGCMIIPACYAYSVDVTSGPMLLFVVMPAVFGQMPLGRIVSFCFFVAMFLASMTTIIGAFEGIIATFIDLFSCSRKKAVLVNLPLMLIFSIPGVLGFNKWSGIQPFGPGTSIFDLEDFIVSNNILPVGALAIVVYTVSKRGFGWKRFYEEANCGKGVRIPKGIYGFWKWCLPVLILALYVIGVVMKCKG